MRSTLLFRFSCRGGHKKLVTRPGSAPSTAGRGPGGREFDNAYRLLRSDERVAWDAFLASLAPGRDLEARLRAFQIPPVEGAPRARSERGNRPRNALVGAWKRARR